MGTLTSLDRDRILACHRGRTHWYYFTIKIKNMFGLKKIAKELDLYRQEEKLKIDLEILEYKKSSVNMAKTCHDEMAEYEHEYHSTKEKRGIELEQLRVELVKVEAETKAKSEMLKNDEVAFERIIKEKDAEIQRLSDIVDSLIENLPNLQELNITNR